MSLHYMELWVMCLLAPPWMRQWQQRKNRSGLSPLDSLSLVQLATSAFTKASLKCLPLVPLILDAMGPDGISGSTIIPGSLNGFPSSYSIPQQTGHGFFAGNHSADVPNMNEFEGRSSLTDFAGAGPNSFGGSNNTPELYNGHQLGSGYASTQYPDASTGQPSLGGSFIAGPPKLGGSALNWPSGAESNQFYGSVFDDQVAQNYNLNSAYGTAKLEIQPDVGDHGFYADDGNKRRQLGL
jgi:hypothetical protein